MRPTPPNERGGRIDDGPTPLGDFQKTLGQQDDQTFKPSRNQKLKGEARKLRLGRIYEGH
jgi:hypothetical protein